jgi:hypothetical protein
MKNTFKINFFLIAILGLSMVFASCKKEDFDVPPIIEPTFSVPAGDTLLTIAQLKAMHTNTAALDSIKNNYWIQGVVIGNDESGNIYKILYIQDATGGILLSLNSKTLYTTYKVGQQVFVKLKNLVFGYPYNSQGQLGAIYGTSTGQLAETAIPKHLFKNGFPGSTPAPHVINGAADLATNNIYTLVRLDSVAFADAGQPYSLSTASTNHNLILKDGSSIIVRTSNYANFKDSLMPAGRGTLYAVLGWYGAYQLTIRDLKDVYGFTTAKK